MKEPIIVPPEWFAVIFQCTYILPIQRDLLIYETFSFLDVGEKKNQKMNQCILHNDDKITFHIRGVQIVVDTQTLSFTHNLFLQF